MTNILIIAIGGDDANAYVAGEQYFPDEMQNVQYYFPVQRGLEIKIAEKLASLRAQDKKARGKT